MRTTTITAASIFALFAAACGDASQSADELNANLPDDTMDGAGGDTLGTGGGTDVGTGGGTPGAGGGTDVGTGGGTPGAGGTDLGTGAGDGAGGTDLGSGGSGDPGTGGMDGTGGTVVEPAGPYDPREGSFKMLGYSKTAAFRHDGSITTGKAMLQDIADEQGFELVLSETNDAFSSVDALSEYEIVFFLNTTGALFSPAEKEVYEEWMTTRDGAFAGVHAATDTENGWDFYSEVTGQYYDGHGAANTPGSIQLESEMLSHPALAGLPNPWQRNEEWYNFNSFQQWSAKPGFAILGRKQADNQPITWIREWSNFRAFYTGLGHDANVFDDANVKKHITGGIMWAVRREHLIQ
jgi:type 1 glutamine amidotransferase